jgi:hypothetical protein
VVGRRMCPRSSCVKPNAARGAWRATDAALQVRGRTPAMRSAWLRPQDARDVTERSWWVVGCVDAQRGRLSNASGWWIARDGAALQDGSSKGPCIRGGAGRTRRKRGCLWRRIGRGRAPAVRRSSSWEAPLRSLGALRPKGGPERAKAEGDDNADARRSPLGPRPQSDMVVAPRIR